MASAAPTFDRGLIVRPEMILLPNLFRVVRGWLSSQPARSISPSSRPNFVFAIPIAGFSDAQQWEHLSELLVRTVRSALNQTNPNFRVMIAGHERPDRLDEIDDPRVEFIEVTFPKPETPKGRRQDKRRKRWAIAARFRDLGGGYFMYLDADDYVHRDLVNYVLKDNNQTGYFIMEGYALDYKNGNLATIPGAWRKPFNHVCGSSGIIFFKPTDLPKQPYPLQRSPTDPFFRFGNHLAFQDVSLGPNPNVPIPFRAAIYNVNNDLNLSNVIVRTEERQQQLIDGIEQRRIEDDLPILAEFGVTKARSPAGP